MKLLAPPQIEVEDREVLQKMLKRVSLKLGVEVVGELDQDRKLMVAKVRESGISQEDFKDLLKDVASSMLKEHSISIDFADGSFLELSLIH